MSYQVAIKGSLHIEPPLSSEGQEELAARQLGWRSTANGTILYWPSDADRPDAIDCLKTAVHVLAKHQTIATGEVEWRGEDEAYGSVTVDGTTVTVTQVESELAPEELTRIQTSLTSASESDRLELIKALPYLDLPIAAVIAPLLQCLEHESKLVRMEAASTLGSFGSDAIAALGQLTLLLDDCEPWVQAAAAEAIGMLGPAAAGAIPALQRLATSPNYGPSGRAREALARISAT